MKKIDNDYKNNEYFKYRGRIKSLIEKHKLLTKIYCFVYIILR